MRRDTVKYIALLFCLTLVIPFLSGCNDTDDVQKNIHGKNVENDIYHQKE